MGKLVPGARFTNGDGNSNGSGQAAVQDDNYDPSTGEYGHGSMTSGIQVANTNNGQGIAAVAGRVSRLWAILSIVTIVTRVRPQQDQFATSWNMCPARTSCLASPQSTNVRPAQFRAPSTRLSRLKLCRGSPGRPAARGSRRPPAPSCPRR
ncbi:MAG: hypothetical protein ABR598_04450 [Candidatus Dormibacteria bacterium]